MDLFEKDFISVKGKKQAAEQIIARYGDFGWELVERYDDKLYCDITHMSFTRPHLIENKDELQLLQVRLEIAFNNTGKYAQKAKSRALIFGNIFGLLAAAFAVCGVVLFLLVEGVLPIVFGSIMCFFGVVIGVAGGIVGYLMYKKDKRKYALLIQEEVKKIDGLCLTARALRGENG